MRPEAKLEHPSFFPKLTSKGLPVVSEATMQYVKEAYEGVDVNGIPEWGRHLVKIQHRMVFDTDYQYLARFVNDEVTVQMEKLFAPFERYGIQLQDPREARLAIAATLVEISLGTISVMEDELLVTNKGRGVLPTVSQETLHTMQALRKNPAEWKQLLDRTETRLRKENPCLDRFISQRMSEWQLPEGWSQAEFSSALIHVALSTIAILEHQATADRLSALFDQSQ